jgi:hypothetical protein
MFPAVEKLLNASEYGAIEEAKLRLWTLTAAPGFIAFTRLGEPAYRGTATVAV